MEDKKNDSYVFTWKIKNYSCNYQLKEENIQSPIFPLESLGGTRWRLTFYPKGCGLVEGENFVSYYLVCLNNSIITETLDINFSLEILDELDKVKCHHNYFNAFSKVNYAHGTKKFMAIDDLAKEMDDWVEDVLTLRCRINHEQLSRQVTRESEVSTKIDVDRRFFAWNVITPALLEHSESVFLPFPNKYEFQITLKTSLKGLELLLCSKRIQYIPYRPVIFKITLKDKRGSRLISKRAGHLFPGEETWKFPDFVTKNLLELCYINSSTYELTLEGEVYEGQRMHTYCKEKIFFKSVNSLPVDTLPKTCPVAAMQNEFKKLFTNKKYSDVTIRVGNEEFHAHKLVLRVRSPVFEAMFEQNMLENETGIVNVNDVEGPTMKTFLEFLYTGTVEKIDNSSARNLLLAADKYQVSSLVDKCVRFLISDLSEENACEIIAIANSINCECLKSRAFDFIVSNAERILVTTNWEQLVGDNIQLATKIITRLSVDLTRKFN